MARARKAETRTMREGINKIAGMRSINETLDLGNNVSVANSESDLQEARAALDEYNQALAVTDEKLNKFKAAEKKLAASNKKILPAVGLKYGTDSSEYEKVGGVRESERAKPRKKKNEPEN